MNFSQVVEEGGVAVELKYCERCGGLWLRPIEDGGSYCEGCRAALAAWPRIMRRTGKTFYHGVPFTFAQGRRRGTRGNSVKAEAHEPVVIGCLLGVVDGADRDGDSSAAPGEIRV